MILKKRILLFIIGILLIGDISYTAILKSTIIKGSLEVRGVTNITDNLIINVSTDGVTSADVINKGYVDSAIASIDISSVTYANTSSTATYSETASTATYAENSDKLDGFDYNYFVDTNTIQSINGEKTFNDGIIVSTITADSINGGFVAGSLIFQGVDGLTEDNSRLYYEDGSLAIGDIAVMRNILQAVKDESVTNFENVKALIVTRNKNTTNNNWVGFSCQTKDVIGNVSSGTRIMTQFKSHLENKITADLVFDTRNEGIRSEKMRLFANGNLQILNELSVSTTTTSVIIAPSGVDLTFIDDNAGTLTLSELSSLDGSAQGQMKFWDAGLNEWVHTETSELFWNDTNKRLGIGEASPDAKLHIKDGSILVEGMVGDTPVSGQGTRLMWIPEKGAFRAGTIGWPPDSWDAINIGCDSVVFGRDGKASGCASTAFGNTNTASGSYSTIFGCMGVASGTASTVFGVNGVASGDSAIHFGNGGMAGGDNSFVGGYGMQLSAAADNSFAFGYYSGWPPITLIQPNTFYIFPHGTAGKLAIGTQTPATSASVDITSTTGALLLPRMTTAQRNALTAVNGMILYNTTTSKIQGYAGGAWVDLH